MPNSNPNANPPRLKAEHIFFLEGYKMVFVVNGKSSISKVCHQKKE